MIKAVCKCRFAQIYLTWEERRQGKRVWLKMIIDLFTWYPHVRPRKQQMLLDNFWWPTSVPSTHCQFLHRVLHSFRWWALSQYDHKRMSNVTAYSHTYRMPQYLRHENTKGDRFHLVWNWFNAKEAATFLIDTIVVRDSHLTQSFSSSIFALATSPEKDWQEEERLLIDMYCSHCSTL